MASMNRHQRNADISIRVGNRQLDNTHGENRLNSVTTATLPLDDRPDAIARGAVDQYGPDVQARRPSLPGSENQQQSARRRGRSLSGLQHRKTAGAYRRIHGFTELRPEKVAGYRRRYFAIFARYPEIETSTVMLLVENSTKYFVSSEGSRIVDSRPLVRVWRWEAPGPTMEWSWRDRRLSMPPPLTSWPRMRS